MLKTFTNNWKVAVAGGSVAFFGLLAGGLAANPFPPAAHASQTNTTNPYGFIGGGQNQDNNPYANPYGDDNQNGYGQQTDPYNNGGFPVYGNVPMMPSTQTGMS